MCDAVRTDRYVSYFSNTPMFWVMIGGLTLICGPASAASSPTYCTPTSASAPKKCSASGPSCACFSSANHASAQTTHQNITVYGSGSRHSYTVPTIEAWGKTPVALKDIPQSVSVITQQRMEDSNMLTMTDAMRQINGIRVMPLLRPIPISTHVGISSQLLWMARQTLPER